MDFHYSDSHLPTANDDVYLADAKRLLSASRKIFNNLTQSRPDIDTSTDGNFRNFLEILHASGMVVTNFDAAQFERGVGSFIMDDKTAGVVASRSNLLAIRMFFTMLARGHHGTWAGYGYPYFKEAHSSGGLKGLFNRLAWLCEVAEANGSKTLYNGPQVDEDK